MQFQSTMQTSILEEMKEKFGILMYISDDFLLCRMKAEDLKLN